MKMLFPRYVFAVLLLIGVAGNAVAQRYNEAWDLLKMRQADTARKVIDGETEVEPGKNLAMTWYVRGMILKSIYDRDDYAERNIGQFLDLQAFDSYKKAVALDKTHEVTDGILEDVLALTEDFCQLGLKCFEKGYEEHDNHQLALAARYLDAVSESFEMLGQRQVTIYKTLDEYGISRRDLEEARALAKDMSGNKEEAVHLYQDLIAKKTQEPTVYLNLKDYYTTHGQKGKALRVLEEGRRQAPKSMPIALAYAELLADTARTSEGLAIALALAKQNPDEPAPLCSAGFIEEKKQEPEKAERYYMKALAQDPTDFQANFRLGKLYFKRAEEGKTRHATQLWVNEMQQVSLRYAELAAQADPKHPGNNRILLELYGALGLADKARELKTNVN